MSSTANGHEQAQEKVRSEDGDSPITTPPRAAGLLIQLKGDPDRAAAERFIEAAYARAFGADLRLHYPVLASVRAADGRILGAAGLRFAREEPLFLEQYLDGPVEAAIARSGWSVVRERIVEIGSLACGDAGASRLLFRSLRHDYLRREGCDVAVATVTRPLRWLLTRVGFQISELAAATPDRLVGGAAGWGDYYDHAPTVVAGPVAPPLGRAA